MKIKSLLAVAVMAIAFTACKKGDTGAQGPKGDAGEPGTGGGKAYSYVYTNQQIDPTVDEGWDEGTGTYTLSGTKNFTPERYKNAVDKGVVLVYLRTNPDGGWVLNSLNYSKTEENGSLSTLSYITVAGKDFIQITGRTRSIFSEGDYLKDHKFDVKVIIIENVEQAALKSKSLNVENISAVEKYYNLSK